MRSNLPAPIKIIKKQIRKKEATEKDSIKETGRQRDRGTDTHLHIHTYIKKTIDYNLSSNFLFHLSSTSAQPQRKCRSKKNKFWIVLPPLPSSSLTSFLLELSSCHSLDLSNLTLAYCYL